MANSKGSLITFSRVGGERCSDGWSPQQNEHHRSILSRWNRQKKGLKLVSGKSIRTQITCSSFLVPWVNRSDSWKQSGLFPQASSKHGAAAATQLSWLDLCPDAPSCGFHPGQGKYRKDTTNECTNKWNNNQLPPISLPPSLIPPSPPHL